VRNCMGMTFIHFGPIKAGECGGRAGSCYYGLHLCFANTLLNAADFAPNKAAHLLQFRLLWRVALEGRLGETEKPRGETGQVLDVTRYGQRKFAASAAEIDEQGAAMSNVGVRQESEVDEATFF